MYYDISLSRIWDRFLFRFFVVICILVGHALWFHSSPLYIVPGIELFFAHV